MPERNLNFDEPVDRRNTDCLKYDFAKRKGMPEDVLPLWVADMDFKTSSYIEDVLVERAKEAIFGYSEVQTPYFQAVANWMKIHHNWEVKRTWLVKTPGVVFALAMAVKAFTDPGDSVIIQSPVYYPFSEVITDNGRNIVSSDLYLGADDRYHMDYADFVFKGQHQVFTAIKKEYEDITLSCTAPSKTFNLVGLSLSNIFIPNRELKRQFKAELKAAGTGLMGVMGLVACQTAYEKGEEWYHAMKSYVQANIEFTKQYVEEDLPGVKMIDHEGTYLVWLDFRETGLGVDELEDLIIHKAKLWLDSGKIFGKNGEGFQRINVACPRSTVKEALDRMKEAMQM